MRKELKYGGYSASPNDHETLEGDLAVAMNLIPEDNTIKPVLPPKRLFDVPNGYMIMCIHKTSAFTHYILWNEDNRTLAFMEQQNDDSYATSTIQTGIALSGVIKVEPIGNTLTILANDGIHYILWKDRNYKYLGSHLPELNVNFRLGQVASSRWQWAEPESVDISEKNGDYSKACNDENLSAMIKQAVMAVANNQMAKNCKAGVFTFPFFVRYAFRLYDGETLTMHSPPILMTPNTNNPTVLARRNHSDNKLVDFRPGSGWAPKTLFHHVSQAEKDVMLQWKDIVSSVDIFISPQFYRYDQAAQNKDINVRATLQDNTDATIALPENKRFDEQLTGNGQFHLIASIPVEKLNTEPVDPIAIVRSDKYGRIALDFEVSNEGIVARDAMTDDYDSHDTLLPAASFAYNNRLNLANLDKVLFRGFWPGLFFHTYGWSQDYYCRCTVVIEQAGQQVIVRSPAGYLNVDDGGKFAWFFYPNNNAKMLYIEHAETFDDLNNGATETFYVKLKQHPLLNGAYFYGLAEDAEVVDGSEPSQEAVLVPPEPTPNPIIAISNKVYTSEVNNPFFFPRTGISSIGTGEIMAICAAVRPVSTSQFGYADLYIFADNGVWVAKITKEGSYSNVELVSGDICINPDSITQMETTVLFATARGIMLLSGSQAQCISGAIDDENQLVPIIDQDGNNIPAKIAGLLGMKMEPVGSFEYFLAECRMLYDYRGQRIIVYNPGYSYAYIYSLESNKWGMMQSNISYTVKDYPRAMAVTSDGQLVNYSEPVEVVQGTALYGSQLLVTRPLTLDQPDILKTVNTVLQRGLFRKHQQHVQSVLYGSRDLYNWFLVSVSADETLRGRRGTPYKWFRIALLLRLPAGESVTGCSIDFDPRYTNRLR
ncbi:MAG: hypothetical protein SPL96_11100 [Bacteroidales bacterium]|nr:hypothetical protein [Bacteroidales bacterium]